jgi:hypothetical protein
MFPATNAEPGESQSRLRDSTVTRQLWPSQPGQALGPASAICGPTVTATHNMVSVEFK